MLKYYWLVSNAPFLGKMLKSIMATQLQEFLIDTDYLSPLQCIFWIASGTETALLVQTDDLHWELNRGNVQVQMPYPQIQYLWVKLPMGSELVWSAEPKLPCMASSGRCLEVLEGQKARSPFLALPHTFRGSCNAASNVLLLWGGFRDYPTVACNTCPVCMAASVLESYDMIFNFYSKRLWTLYKKCMHGTLKIYLQLNPYTTYIAYTESLSLSLKMTRFIQVKKLHICTLSFTY